METIFEQFDAHVLVINTKIVENIQDATSQAQHEFYTNINVAMLDFKALVTQATQDLKTIDISSTPSTTTASCWSKVDP